MAQKALHEIYYVKIPRSTLARTFTGKFNFNIHHKCPRKILVTLKTQLFNVARKSAFIKDYSLYNVTRNCVNWWCRYGLYLCQGIRKCE